MRVPHSAGQAANTRGIRCWATWLLGLLMLLPFPAWADTDAPAANPYLEAMQPLIEGRFEEASEALHRLVAQEPEHAGAWLDLAILQCRLGNAEEAEILFQAIEVRFDPPPGIREIIALQRAKGCQAPAPRWEGRLRLSRGSDDNVNQGASNPNFTIGQGSNLLSLVLSPEFTPQRDRFNNLSLEGSVSGVNGWQGYAQLQARRYDHLSRYNSVSTSVGAERVRRFAGWDTRLGGSLGLTQLGGKDYQRYASLNAWITPPLPLPAGWQLSGLTGVSHVVYPSRSYFDSSLWEARGVLTYQQGPVWLQGSGGYGVDIGNGARAGGDRHGLFASLSARAALGGGVLGELGWLYQSWAGARSYSPGLIDVARRQHTQLLRAMLSLPLSKEHGLFLEYRTVRNRENISLFAYQSRSVQLGWQWQFGR